MRSLTRHAARLAVTLTGAGLLAAGLTGAPAGAANGGNGHHVAQHANGDADVNVCSDQVGPGQARCFARARTDAAAKSRRPGAPQAGPSARPNGTQATPAGVIGNSGAYDPAYLRSAYNAPSLTAGSGQTVAIVDAYDDPSAAADLSAYRAQFGLPACTTANGCFHKVDQNGSTAYPTADSGWGQEISLDLDMVSAICQNCNILLVEANSSYLSDLGAAVNTAVRLGANVVSNSYGGPEYSGEASDSARYYNHPGVAIVASSGDSGYGAQFPAASQYVTAVGGTSLTQTTNSGTRNATESVWSGAGSGCSAYVTKPTWQKDSGCANRTVADVSTVADPSTGVWVYDTYASSGWLVFGGTSAAAPIVGSMFALAANPASSAATASYPYGGQSHLNDVTTGSNGSCSTAYLCAAATGYDGPSGLGTPNGVVAFQPSSAPASGVPGPPQNLTASATTAIALAWSAPTTGGTPTSYRIFRGLSSGAEGTMPIATVTGTAFSDATALNGTRYYYRVAAVDGAGQGAYSAETSALMAGLPGAPGLRASTSSRKGVLLSITAPTTNGGSPITSYKLYRSTASGAETSYLSVNCSGSCSYTDTGTSNGTTYFYRAAAVNAAGAGPQSSQTYARAR